MYPNVRPNSSCRSSKTFLAENVLELVLDPGDGRAEKRERRVPLWY
jgi:hypothetical protein